MNQHPSAPISPLPGAGRGPGGEVHLDLPQLTNEQGEPMRLLAAWLMGDLEGAIFYSGTGGTASAYPVPPGATGFRLRRWTSEGLAPEYLDRQFDGSSVHG
jgi:hypothetical protein